MVLIVLESICPDKFWWIFDKSFPRYSNCYNPFRQPFPFRNGNFPFRNQYGFKLGRPFRNPYTLSTQMLAWPSLAWCIVIALQYLHINIHYSSYSFIYTLLDAHIQICKMRGYKMGSFKMGSFPFRNGKLPVSNWKLPILKPNIDRPVPSKFAL